jgi:hypothetical protein
MHSIPAVNSMDYLIVSLEVAEAHGTSPRLEFESEEVADHGQTSKEKERKSCSNKLTPNHLAHWSFKESMSGFGK